MQRALGIRKMIRVCLFLLAGVFVCGVPSAWAQVAYDNKVSSGFQWGVTSVTTPAFSIGAGANRAAMIMITMDANTATNFTATLGGVPGILIAGTDSGTAVSMRTLIFCVTNPPSGSQTATVSWTTSMDADVGVITASGANQSTACTNGSFTAVGSAPSASTSLTVTSNSGDLTATVGYTQNQWTSPYTNQNLKWGLDSSATGGDVGSGAGNTTHTWTDQYSSQTHVISGANFKAAGSGGGSPNFSLTSSPGSQTVTAGGSTSYGITITPSGGFTGQVSLNLSGLPSGASGNFSSNPASGSSTLTVNTNSGTPVANSTLTITGSSGGITNIATVSLGVYPAGSGGGGGGSGTGGGPCDLNNDGVVNSSDITLAQNQALNPPSPCPVNINGAGGCNVAVIQRVVNASMGSSCHPASVSWNASSSSNIAGYNVYRSTTSGGGYTKINSGLVSGTSYADTTSMPGQTYYYVVTTVDTSNNESAYSNPPAVATVASP